MRALRVLQYARYAVIMTRHNASLLRVPAAFMLMFTLLLIIVILMFIIAACCLMIPLILPMPLIVLPVSPLSPRLPEYFDTPCRLITPRRRCLDDATPPPLRRFDYMLISDFSP